MPFGYPDELKREKALASRTLTQALGGLVGIVEHGGKIGPEMIEDPEERKALLEEVTDWFAHPYEGQCSLDLICAHLPVQRGGVELRRPQVSLRSETPRRIGAGSRSRT
jgi:hypothetical protein